MFACAYFHTVIGVCWGGRVLTEGSLSASASDSKFVFLPLTKEEVNAFARVCLSVCLLSTLLKNVCMDLDEMLCVDRCREMDELINF